MQSVWWRILFNLVFTSPHLLFLSLLIVVVILVVVVSFSSFKKSVPKFLTTFSLNFHSRLLVSRAIAFSHDKNDDESKWKSCRKNLKRKFPTATAPAENCNEYNQNSSRIHFKFIINYRGFPLETTQRRREIYADLYCDSKNVLFKWITS